MTTDIQKGPGIKKKGGYITVHNLTGSSQLNFYQAFSLLCLIYEINGEVLSALIRKNKNKYFLSSLGYRLTSLFSYLGKSFHI